MGIICLDRGGIPHLHLHPGSVIGISIPPCLDRTRRLAARLPPLENMKTKPKYFTIAALAFWSVAILFSLLQTVSGQGFTNLNFELASVVSAPPGYTPVDANLPISAAAALPYWIVREDGTVCTAIWGAPNALDETSVALVSGGSYPNYTPLQGAYSVQLYAYADAPADYFHNASISQTGLVPFGTHSIQFLMFSPPVAGGVIQANPVVTLNGTLINLSPISTSGGVVTMAGDVSAFAGTTANLTILCAGVSGSPPLNENVFALDAISFSPTSIPEPSVFGLFALTALGGLLLGFRRWQNSSRCLVTVPDRRAPPV